MAEHYVITGAAGFLGQHLVRAARARGATVTPVVRVRDERAPAEALTLDELTQRFPNGIEATAVIHAAAIRHRHGATRADYRKANVELVEQLMAALAPATRFVHVSSVGVYGFPRILPITERTRFAPVTSYSESKVEAEALVAREATRRGLPFVIARPTIVYGPGDTNGMMDKLATAIRNHRYLIVGSGRNTLHHTYVDDMVDGLLLCATHPRAVGEDFILCGPETTTLRKMSQQVARELKRIVPPIRIPLAVARAAATVFDGALRFGLYTREPPINHEKLDVMTLRIAFSHEKATRLLGFHPRVGYTEGIRRTLAASSER
jgi:nucleoside-diphosphate-sugar epimerase